MSRKPAPAVRKRPAITLPPAGPLPTSEGAREREPDTAPPVAPDPMAELDAASAAFEALCVGCDLADLEELIAFAVDQLEEGAPPNLPAGVQRSIRRTVRARAFKAAGLVDPTLPAPAPAPAPAPSPAADDGGTIAAMRQLPEEARRELEKLMGGRPGQSAQLVNAHGIGASEPNQADPVPPAPPAEAAQAPSAPPPPPRPAPWASAPHAVGAHPIPPAPARAAAPPPLPPGAGHLGRASQVQGASKLSTASTEMQRVSQAAGVSRAGAVGSSLVGLAREARRVSTPAAGPDPEAGRLGDFELAGAAALLDQAIARRASAGVAGDLDQELAQMAAALRSGRY